MATISCPIRALLVISLTAGVIVLFGGNVSAAWFNDPTYQAYIMKHEVILNVPYYVEYMDNVFTMNLTNITIPKLDIPATPPYQFMTDRYRFGGEGVNITIEANYFYNRYTATPPRQAWGRIRGEAYNGKLYFDGLLNSTTHLLTCVDKLEHTEEPSKYSISNFTLGAADMKRMVYSLKLQLRTAVVFPAMYLYTACPDFMTRMNADPPF